MSKPTEMFELRSFLLQVAAMGDASNFVAALASCIPNFPDPKGLAAIKKLAATCEEVIDLFLGKEGAQKPLTDSVDGGMRIEEKN